MFYQWLKYAQSALLAPRCILCRAPTSLAERLCDACHADLPWITNACVTCALPLPSTAGTPYCPDCRQRPAFDQAIAACRYIQPLPWLITRLKFSRQMHHAPLLGELVARAIKQTEPTLPDCLIPVPLHPRAYRRRGFNQAERIAIHLGRRIQRPVITKAVARQRDTPAQSHLTAARRAANVRGAFRGTADLAGQHVAIVDDVMTTTRTALALADALYAAGTTRIDMYCVARA